MPVSAGSTVWSSREHTEAYWSGWLDGRYDDAADFTANRRLAKLDDLSDRLEYYRGHRAGREARLRKKLPRLSKPGTPDPRRAPEDGLAA